MHSLARSIALGLLLAASATQAAPWTYRGTLNDGGAPANGRYDIRLSLLDAAGAKSLAYPLTFNGVEVKNGSFAIDVDFGVDLTQFGALRLKTEVAQGGSGFVALGEPKAFDAKAALGSVCWDTAGNAATNPATDFLGTTDNQKLMFRVNNAVGFRLEPGALGPNVVGGASANTVSASDPSQVIAGGGSNGTGCGPIGADPCNNVTQAAYATVGGGRANQATEFGSVVAGGESNSASGWYSVVSGGKSNQAQDFYAALGGGELNRASGSHGTVSGGERNRAIGDHSSVVGGDENTANALASVALGGQLNCAGGEYSAAGGQRAIVRSSDTACGSSSGDFNGDEGAFVWADSQNADFVSTGPNQFLIRSNGGVGINTNKLGNYPNFRLAEMTIRNSTANGNVDLNLMTSNARGYSLAVIPDGAAGAGSFYLQELNAISTGEPTWTPRLIVTASGQTQVQGGAVGTISDARLKKDIGAIDRPLETFLGLRGHTFEYTDPAKALGATGTRMGFVAQEVKNVLPQWVSKNGEGYFSVAPSGFEALAVEAVREQQQHINALQSENRTLHDVVRGLSERLAALEAAKEH